MRYKVLSFLVCIMISTTTYADFYDYIRQRPSGSQLYYFIQLRNIAEDLILYYSDYHLVFSNYLPTKIEVSPVVYNASLFTGNYIIKEVKIIIENTLKDGASRFIDNFASDEFESGKCIIYLGYHGISDSADLFPFYQGDMTDFNYSLLSCEFTIIDRSILELPKIPNNKFTIDSFPNISPELIGKPIPFVYGRWDYEPPGTTLYGDRSYIPGYVTVNNLNQSTPQIVTEFADHALDRMSKIFIYDENMGTVGEILDDITTDLANARATINTNTYSNFDYLTTLIYLYGDKLGPITNANNTPNAVDWNFDTYASIIAGGAGDPGSLDIMLSKAGKIGDDELVPIFTSPSGKSSIGLFSVEIQFSAFKQANFTTGGVNISIANSNYAEAFGVATVNSWTETDTFAITCPTKLVVCYPKYFDGSTSIFFAIEEADNASGTNAQGNKNIIPPEGYYHTMTQVGEAADAAVQETGGLTNTYKIAYRKDINKFIVSVVTSGLHPYFKIKTAGESSNLGMTTSSAWSNTSQTGESPTLLDIIDGDFSNLKVNIEVTSTDIEQQLNLKAIRLKIVRSYRDYTIWPYIAGRRRRFNRRGGDYQKSDPPASSSFILYHITGKGRGRIKRTPYAIMEIDQERRLSIRNTLSGSKYLASIDGRPDNGSYFKKGPEIIQSILEDYIGIATADIDTTNFSTANGNRSHELAVYQAEEIETDALISDIARYSMGFWFIGQDGLYKMAVTKSSYSSGDVNKTIYLRDIKAPSQKNLKYKRNSIAELSKNLYFHYLYNWATDEFNDFVNKTTNQSLNIQQNNIFCSLITNDTHASTVAEYFAGTGGTYGQFGELKTVAEFTTLNLEYLFHEIGDIMKFSTEFDAQITAFGGTLSNIYFICIGKQYDKREIKLTLLEVG